MIDQWIFSSRPAHLFLDIGKRIDSFVSQFIPEPVDKALNSLFQPVINLGSVHSKNFPLMNPAVALLIAMSYLLFVIAGKALAMRLQVKFSMKMYSMIHNAVMVAVSTYMCIETLRQAFMVGNYSLFSNATDESPQGKGMAAVIWLFYFSKIFEFNDTFIMIMKQNFRQISFLHVYHHSSIYLIWWLVTLVAPTGEAYFSAFLNSFIHVVMYGYYLLSSLGIKQVHVIKHYITSLQMAQFMLMMVQATYNIVTGFDGYPLYLSKVLWVYMVSMLGLFANFLIQDKKRLQKIKTK